MQKERSVRDGLRLREESVSQRNGVDRGRMQSCDVFQRTY